jgi:amino acid transporter
VSAAPRDAAPSLRRALGRWDLTAIGVNIVIGAGVFLVPAQVAAQVGGWSPLVCVFLGLSSLLIGLCFAEVSSRFEGTGGPYLYTRAAFGRFLSFEVGWMYWFTRVAAQAAVVNGLVQAFGYYWPEVARPASRASLITGITVLLAWVNVRGIRQASWVVNALTIGKLLPLGVFVGVGLFAVDLAALAPKASVSWTQASTAALLLLFIFSGYEVVPVPAGEATNPRGHAPFAVVATIVITTLVNTLVVVVCLGTLPGLASSQTPLADAAQSFMGPPGALLIGAGTLISSVGTTAGLILTASRMLFAMAENGDLPGFLGVIHREYRTPANAVLFTAAVALALALSGSFVALVAASAVSRLLTYVGVCGSTLVLRRGTPRAGMSPASFVVPLGPLVPSLALLVSLVILASVTRDQLLAGILALGAGAVLFAAARRPDLRPV